MPRMTCTSIALALGLMTAVTISSEAAVITFEGAPGGRPILTTVASGGFTFTSSHLHWVDGGETAPDLASNGTDWIGEEAGSLGGPITMAVTGGGVFSIQGFDASELWAIEPGGFPRATSIGVSGALFGGGTLSASFLLDGIVDGVGGAADFQSFVFSGWDNLVSVTFTGLIRTARGAAAYDNIIVNERAVPEPAALLLIGAGLTAYAARRRRRV